MDVRRLWIACLLVVLAVGLVGPSPAVASIHTYHERPGQTTYRSQQSLRDRTDQAWQATLFKRYVDDDLQGVYLRLVGFPGLVAVDKRQPLSVTTGTGLDWRLPPSLDPQTQTLPDNVAQYDAQPLLSDLKGAIPLEMGVPLSIGVARFVVAPFVTEEWLELADIAD